MAFEHIQLRRDTAANWTANNPILLLGETGWETDTLKTKLGDGVTAWNSLAYANITPAQLASTAAGQGDALIGVLQPYAGAYPTTQSEFNSRTVYVWDYLSAAQRIDVAAGTYTLDCAAAINTAIADAAGNGGGDVIFPSGILKCNSSILAKSYVKLKGAYTELPTDPAPGPNAPFGTTIRWGGGNTGTILNCYNVRLFELDGILLDGQGGTSLTGILLDSNNSPSGSQNEFRRFSIRNCFIGVQWGTSGLVGSYANDGTRFNCFTIWSTVAGSVGFILNSGNCGQDSIIESGGIQTESIGIDIVVAAYPQIKRVFGGGPMATAFIRYAFAFGVLIESSSAECSGPYGPNKWATSALFLLVVGPPGGITQAQVLQQGITLINNTFNNPIVCNSGARITSIGNIWGQSWNGAATVPATGSFGAGGFSYVSSINDSSTFGNPETNVLTSGTQSGMPAWGWQDSAYCDLTLQSPEFGWYNPVAARGSGGFVAGDFTGLGGMSWTVTYAGVETLTWTQNGRTMTVSFKINSGTTAGTANTGLNIKIPSGKTATLGVLTACRVTDNGTQSIGFCSVGAGSQQITIQKNDVSNFALSNNAGCQGQITFEVN